MTMRYKSFREQFMECNENGTCCKMTINIPYIPEGSHFAETMEFEVNVCRKYMKQCNSRVCKADRMRSDDWYENG